MAGFLFRLETWTVRRPAADVIPLGHRSLRVIGKRDDDADQPPVLIVDEE